MMTKATRIRDGYGSRICVYCKRGRARTWVASMGYAHKRCIEANARFARQLESP